MGDGRLQGGEGWGEAGGGSANRPPNDSSPGEQRDDSAAGSRGYELHAYPHVQVQVRATSVYHAWFRPRSKLRSATECPTLERSVLSFPRLSHPVPTPTPLTSVFRPQATSALRRRTLHHSEREPRRRCGRVGPADEGRRKPHRRPETEAGTNDEMGGGVSRAWRMEFIRGPTPPPPSIHLGTGSTRVRLPAESSRHAPPPGRLRCGSEEQRLHWPGSARR